MQEVGSTDSRDQALTYLKSLSLGKMDEVLIETYVDTAAEVIRFLETVTELRFTALKVPDYHPENPGGTFGRSVTSGLFPAKTLGAHSQHLRRSAHFPIPLSLAEVDDGRVDVLDVAKIADRMANDVVGTGAALMAALFKAALDQGVALEREVRARHLVMEDGAVIGVRAERGGDSMLIRARRGVVIASGGFEWNAALTKSFIFGPPPAPLSPPFNEGDGLMMAMEAGAELGNMSEAWFHASMRIPNEEYEGRPLNRLTSPERHSPGSIIVNRHGNRFVDESLNYHDICHPMRAVDPGAFELQNLPAWVIVHKGFLDRYPFMTRYPGDPVPNWLTQAPTLRELAQKIGVDAIGLERTVARFNENARVGVDPDFGRGASAYGRYYGDRSRDGAFQTLGPLDEAPFFACEIRIGAIGTRGGPKVNTRAEVLSIRGGIIPGLYAAGNAMASFTGMSYPGAGGTIGPALTFGYIAGKSAATRGVVE